MWPNHKNNLIQTTLLLYTIQYNLSSDNLQSSCDNMASDLLVRHPNIIPTAGIVFIMTTNAIYSLKYLLYTFTAVLGKLSHPSLLWMGQ